MLMARNHPNLWQGLEERGEEGRGERKEEGGGRREREREREKKDRNKCSLPPIPLTGGRAYNLLAYTCK